ncbi:MAG TPA: hypothetical protein VMO26_09535 [Vicinamibacterales bacterium]|nr:hypothetical protein [Vicinamibacterales bacterium]
MKAQLRRDWHQLRLLSKDGVRHLIDTALLSRDSDPTQFVIWLLALVATPTAFFAARQVHTYTVLMRAPEELVQLVALQHRLFFITYGMLAAALLAALIWEAVFPDGRDQEIVGVLPVRPHVFAASRLGAAIIVGTVFAAAVNLPGAVLYTMFSAGHPTFGWNILGLLAGHTMATMMGSLLVFFGLLIVRGLAAVLFGAGAGKWLGALLQIVTVVLLFEAFFFLPGILGTLATGVMRGDAAIAMFPPVWFAALHTWVVGHANQMLENAMLTGLVWFAVATLIVVPMYLLPARWLGRRALEQRSRERAAATTFVVRTVSSFTHAPPSVRGVFLFAVASLVRSQRHLIVLATYFGLAVAVSIISVFAIDDRESIRLDRPASWMLALPMLFLFFGVIGLRASCRIPTEVEANWPFRLARPSLGTCVNATVLLMLTLAALPVAGLTLIMLAPRWPPSSTFIVVALQMLSALMLIEALLLRWRKVPFACAHAPSPDFLKAWWPVYGVAMYWFAFGFAEWQLAATRSTRAAVWYTGTCLAIIAAVRLLRHRDFHRHQLEFDLAPGGSLDRLNLSEALN